MGLQGPDDAPRLKHTSKCLSKPTTNSLLEKLIFTSIQYLLNNYIIIYNNIKNWQCIFIFCEKLELLS